MNIDVITQLIIGFCLTLITHIPAYTLGYFTINQRPNLQKLSFLLCIGSFLLGLILYVTFPFLGLTLTNYLFDLPQFTNYLGPFVFTFFLTPIIFGLYKSLMPSTAYSSQVNKDFFQSLIIYLIALPCIFFFNSLFEALNIWLFDFYGKDQLAVQFLKDSLKSPLTAFFSLSMVCIFAPIIEEIIFRGFLYQYLRSKFSFWPSSIIAGILFSIVHYAPMQELSNIPLLGILFILSFYLSFILEKRKTILAPIFLHMIFNLITAIRIMAI